ncbi:MAG: hypothetical protein HQL51_10360 [Magnetococcales bacterium]|nr:hypothetical protein [Magnetococcales bacterium]
MSDDDKKIQEVKDLFDLAEKEIKAAERVGSGLGIPAINELRYAGHHVLEYMTSKDIDGLERAKNHILRARYDAAEAPIILILKKLEDFQKEFSSAIITEDISEYVVQTMQLERIKNEIGEISPENRERYVEEIRPHVAQLTEIHAHWMAAAPEINKRRRQERRKLWMNLLGVLLTLIGVIVGLATWLVPR